jgi:polar amino acid transport system substrate-binding protein
VVDASSEDKATTALTSVIYNDSEVLIANPSDATEYKTWNDLRNQVIGSRTGAIYEDEVKKAGFEIRSYAAVPELYNAVNSGVVKVGINTTVVATFYTLLQGRYPNIKVVTTYQAKFPRLSAIGGRKESSELIGRIDTSLVKMKTDGSVRAIFSKYGIADTLVK